MDITLTEEQTMISDTAQAFAKNALTPKRIQALESDETGFDRPTWAKMVEMGWAAAPFPAEYGGAGLGLPELALIMEALGRGAVPSPIYSTVIEAGACGIPAVASRIYGLTDAVVHGRTGLLVTRGDVGELAQAMERLGKDRKLRLRMGRVAQRRAKVRFDQKKITEALLQFYRKILPLH